MDELRNATYAGIDDRLGPVTLRNGRWEGAPAISGGSSRPVVQIADDFRVVGDLDGDDVEESVVLLSYSTGGSGAFSFLAVVTGRSGTLRNVGTAALGDRVQLRSARIADDTLSVSAVRAGESDAACCPGELVDMRWTLRAGRLELLGTVAMGRLSLATLAGTTWVLRAWDIGDPAASEPAVTLTYDAGRFAGSSGCNRFVAGVAAGGTPGAITVGPSAGTRMACPDPQAAVETRFLEQLGGAQSIGFWIGKLAIGYVKTDGTRGTMLFDASVAPVPRAD